MSSGQTTLGGHAGYGAIPGISLTGGPYAIGGAGQHEYDDGIDIRVTAAAGGFVVSVFHRNSGQRPELHIVPEDKDLGTEIGKIITVSYLKKE